jgi:hypothetical protein
MKFVFRMTLMIMCLVVSVFCLSSCSEKKEAKKGKIEITEKNFSFSKDGKFSYTLDVTGKIRNVGDVAVKNLVVTGYCRSCKEVMISNTWYVTQVVKRAEQEAQIGYLAPGEEKDYHFDGIAYYYSQSSEPPQGLPEKLEVVVESFETVEE